MEPVLNERSIVGVDAAVRSLGEVAGKICAVRIPELDGLTVKRVLVDAAGGQVILRPENRRYADRVYRVEEVEEQRIIAGRVMWAWSLFE